MHQVVYVKCNSMEALCVTESAAVVTLASAAHITFKNKEPDDLENEICQSHSSVWCMCIYIYI